MSNICACGHSLAEHPHSQARSACHHANCSCTQYESDWAGTTMSDVDPYYGKRAAVHQEHETANAQKASEN